MDEKIAVSWPVLLDEFIESREYLLQEALKFVGSDNDIAKIGRIINLIINGEDVKQIKPFWKYFNTTQIYKIYLHDK